MKSKKLYDTLLKEVAADKIDRYFLLIRFEFHHSGTNPQM